jgi:hypothetical protein
MYDLSHARLKFLKIWAWNGVELIMYCLNPAQDLGLIEERKKPKFLNSQHCGVRWAGDWIVW